MLLQTMPYAKKRYRRKRKFRKRKKKSFGSKLLRDARTRGTNSAAELAVKIIAKREAKKLLGPNLIFRRQVWGDYDRLANIFGAGTPIDMDGLIVHMPQIPIWDIQTANATLPSADLNLVPPIPFYMRGTNVLAAGVAQDQFRTSNKVSLQSLGFDLRFYLPMMDPLQALPRREDVTIRWRIVAVTHPDAYIAQWTPKVEDVLAYKGLGFSSRLDKVIQDPVNDLKFKVLKQGKYLMKYSTDRTKERFISTFLKTNITYEFQSYIENVQPYSQNGQRVTGRVKIFLVLRADCAANAAPEHKPTVIGFYKVGYRNVV